MSAASVILEVPKGLTEEELSQVILFTDAQGRPAARGSGGQVDVSATRSQGTFVMRRSGKGEYVSRRADAVYRVASIPLASGEEKLEGEE